MGMIYITIVYKVYRFDTFLIDLTKQQMGRRFYDSWYDATRAFPDYGYLLIIYFTYILKAVVTLRLVPFLGPVYVIAGVLFYNVWVFAIFFSMMCFCFAFLFAILYIEEGRYSTIETAFVEIFGTSSGIFSMESDVFYLTGPDRDIENFLMICYSILSFVLIVHLLVGQLANAYRKYAEHKEVYFLL